MRKWTVIGFKVVNYTSKRTGNKVEGYNLYLTSGTNDNTLEGEECKEVFLSRKSSAYKPYVGDEVQIIYNERGYVDDIVSC